MSADHEMTCPSCGAELERLRAENAELSALYDAREAEVNEVRAQAGAMLTELLARDEAAKAVVRWWDRTAIPVRDHLSVVLVAALDALADAHREVS